MTDDSGRQRIDKWLWFARVVKTRALAQDLAQSGHVRLNGRKVDAAAHPVKAGDVLTVGLAGRVRVLRVVAFAPRRGPHAVAASLYEDLTEPALTRDTAGPPEGVTTDPPATAPVPEAPRPVRGEGRPTKRDRRRMDRDRADSD